MEVREEATVGALALGKATGVVAHKVAAAEVGVAVKLVMGRLAVGAAEQEGVAEGPVVAAAAAVEQEEEVVVAGVRVVAVAAITVVARVRAAVAGVASVEVDRVMVAE